MFCMGGQLEFNWPVTWCATSCSLQIVFQSSDRNIRETRCWCLIRTLSNNWLFSNDFSAKSLFFYGFFFLNKSDNLLTYIFNSSLPRDVILPLRVLQHCSDVTVHKGFAFLLSFRLNLDFLSCLPNLWSKLGAAELLTSNLVLQLVHHIRVVALCALQAARWSSAVHLLVDRSHRKLVAARLRSASRGSAAFGAEVGRMAEKQRRWKLHRGIPIYDVVKYASGQRISNSITVGHWQSNKKR